MKEIVEKVEEMKAMNLEMLEAEDTDILINNIYELNYDYEELLMMLTEDDII